LENPIGAGVTQHPINSSSHLLLFSYRNREVPELDASIASGSSNLILIELIPSNLKNPILGIVPNPKKERNG